MTGRGSAGGALADRFVGAEGAMLTWASDFILDLLRRGILRTCGGDHAHEEHGKQQDAANVEGGHPWRCDSHTRPALLS